MMNSLSFGHLPKLFLPCIFSILLLTSSFFSCHKEPEITLADGYQQLRANEISFYWKIDQEKKELEAKVVAQTEGWVAAGFNPTDKMMGALMVMGAIRDGVAKVQLHYGNTIQTHKPVKELGMADVLLSGSIRKDGDYMILEFRLPMSSILEHQLGEKTKVLLAFGKSARMTSYHMLNRTSVDIKL